MHLDIFKINYYYLLIRFYFICQWSLFNGEKNCNSCYTDDNTNSDGQAIQIKCSVICKLIRKQEECVNIV